MSDTIKSLHLVIIINRITFLHKNPFLFNRKFIIFPLSLDLPLNTLTFTGGFSTKEMHNYLQEMIPDLPISHEDEIKYVFKSALVGSILICAYQKGKATFQSDSVSTIAIIKDFVNNMLN